MPIWPAPARRPVRARLRGRPARGRRHGWTMRVSWLSPSPQDLSGRSLGAALEPLVSNG